MLRASDDAETLCEKKFMREKLSNTAPGQGRKQIKPQKQFWITSAKSIKLLFWITEGRVAGNLNTVI
ncbi:hypothetical protein A2482_02685 [Candidatus Falkowbacteria bacterium RIFOXYC2_FULL_48_21]|uniref:Uncharacterized protein n=1 Tax=Candidatus Falkowbacteria bacterium RIFOXYC2_FULL_48_21 TaxID=1798005 RepID=A0A1F5TB16_9BACT|nr:MAG: hypothetical protein A2482_02685 [Candidatus Falkowbacteria bacterium RIFOXYC2_FULL_48_21]